MGVGKSVGGIFLLGASLAACGGTPTSTSTASSPTAAASSAGLVSEASMQVGGKMTTVLKDSKGLTLYFFTPDSSTKIACTGPCATNWPPLLASGTVPSTMSGLPGTFSVVDGANGKQVAYNGHPLYTYFKDKTSGDVFGQGIGGKWFVATPDLSSATSSSTGSQYPAYGG